ncbi:MAG: hypothetical protein ACJ8G7_08105 [Rhizobacter sp.]
MLFAASLPPGHRDRIVAGMLLLAVALAYSNGFAGGFQFDDFNVIVREASVQSVSAWWRAQPGIRPLLKLSYALNHESGGGLAGFHVFNLAVHVASTLLVWRLASVLAPAASRDASDPRRLAFMVAVVFALHPVQTEAVTYVSGRSTSLAACFALLAIVLWLRGRERDDRRAVSLWSPLAFAAALGCKEFVVVVPLALVLCERLRVEGPLAWRTLWHDVRVHVVVAAMAFAAAAAVPRYRLLLDTSLAARGIVANLLTQAQALGWLAGQLVHVDALNADPALRAVTASDGAAWLAAIVWAGLIAASLWSWRRHRTAAFALLWFLLWLAPTNSLLPRLDVANDRQLYVALIGPAFGAAALLVRFAPRGGVAMWVPMLMLVLGAAAWQRNRVYQDELGFWADVATKSPHNARAFANLGHALADRGRAADAESAFDVALQLDPRLHQAAINRQLLRAGEWPPGAARP